MATRPHRPPAPGSDEALHEEAERIAIPDCDWIDLLVCGLADAATHLAPHRRHSRGDHTEPPAARD